ncbi:Hypothetical protein SMAX5B_021205 [Scophthalmus maximus]|uniref:Uncharacterized protein n=1 Tax=Scophthalmus maximus TaxID=52904 RepID=A0A2U9BE98_SCOMX|nr:Hypothetical protein SMAX5B_021205 [Scophthalmus maximus]
MSLCGGQQQNTQDKISSHTLIEVQYSLCIFEGKTGQVFLSYDQSAFEQKKYLKDGSLIAWSIALGGPVPDCSGPRIPQDHFGDWVFSATIQDLPTIYRCVVKHYIFLR